MSQIDLRDLVSVAREAVVGEVADGRLVRATLEIEVDGQQELIVLSAAADGTLRAVASDGATDGPHVRAALSMLAGEQTVSSGRQSELPTAPGSISAPRVASPFADALEELVTAVVRAGLRGAPGAVAVREAVERVLREAPRPTPPGLGRALARLRRGLVEGDVDLVARILDGAARLARDLREEVTTDEARRRIAAWTVRPGARSANAETLNERELVEVGREWLPTAGAASSVQRRYLVCTTTGEVFREEHTRGAAEASVGPCPRTLRVGLAQVEEGPAPRRIRLLQYEVAPELTVASHERLTEMAEREVRRVHERYRKWVRQYPALAEPVIILRAEGRLRETAGAFRLDDDEGGSIGLRPEPGVATLLRECEADRSSRWIAGRLAESEGRVVLEPIALGLTGDSGARLLRL